MRTLTLPTLAAFLLQLSALTLTLPTQPPPPLLLPRTQYCANSPSTVAGTFLPPRSLLLPPRSPFSPLSPRTPAPPSTAIPISGSTTQIFCRPGTRTYIVVRFLHEIPGRAILSLLEDAYDAIYDIIENLGDGIIPQGYYSYPGAAASAAAASSSSAAAAAATAHGGLQVYAQNVNNHQQTWGVLGGAVASLMSYMESEEWNRGAPGSAEFSIYDGFNEVARGAVGPR